MDLSSSYIEHMLTALDGITAFSVAQGLSFTYWCQTDEFKDNLRYGRWPTIGTAYFMCITFTCAYIYALFYIKHDLVTFLAVVRPEHLADLTTGLGHAVYERAIVIAVFGIIDCMSLMRYLFGKYDRKKWDHPPHHA